MDKVAWLIVVDGGDFKSYNFGSAYRQRAYNRRQAWRSVTAALRYIAVFTG